MSGDRIDKDANAAIARNGTAGGGEAARKGCARDMDAGVRIVLRIERGKAVGALAGDLQPVVAIAGQQRRASEIEGAVAGDGEAVEAVAGRGEVGAADAGGGAGEGSAGAANARYRDIGQRGAVDVVAEDAIGAAGDDDAAEGIAVGQRDDIAGRVGSDDRAFAAADSEGAGAAAEQLRGEVRAAADDGLPVGERDARGQETALAAKRDNDAVCAGFGHGIVQRRRIADRAEAEPIAAVGKEETAEGRAGRRIDRRLCRRRRDLVVAFQPDADVAAHALVDALAQARADRVDRLRGLARGRLPVGRVERHRQPDAAGQLGVVAVVVADFAGEDQRRARAEGVADRIFEAGLSAGDTVVVAVRVTEMVGAYTQSQRMVLGKIDRRLDADLALDAPGGIVAAIDGGYLFDQLIADQ